MEERGPTLAGCSDSRRLAMGSHSVTCCASRCGARGVWRLHGAGAHLCRSACGMMQVRGRISRTCSSPPRALRVRPDALGLGRMCALSERLA